MFAGTAALSSVARAAAKHVVEPMLDDVPSKYVRSLSPDRFSENGWDWSTARRDAQHYYETYYCLKH
jgi:hypothetical protein